MYTHLHLIPHPNPFILGCNNCWLRCTNSHDCSLKLHQRALLEAEEAFTFTNQQALRMALTFPGGKIASKRSTPNIPRLESVNVPTC